MAAKRTHLLVMLALLGVTATARGDEQPLQERAWFKKAPWTEDYEKARDEAKRTGKLIFAYFTQHH